MILDSQLSNQITQKQKQQPNFINVREMFQFNSDISTFRFGQSNFQSNLPTNISTTSQTKQFKKSNKQNKQTNEIMKFNFESQSLFKFPSNQSNHSNYSNQSNYLPIERNLKKIKNQNIVENEESLKSDKSEEERIEKSEIECDIHTNFHQSFQNHLQCSICFDELDNPFSVTSCMHTFCEKCIKDWKRVSDECPLCKKTIRNLKKNYLLCELLETYKSYKNQIKLNQMKENEKI